MTFRAAFYKGEGNAFNGFIRFWDGGIYSHCELVFSDGMSASASWRDGRQVRLKMIEYDADNWDFIELPPELEESARTFFEQTKGRPYDLVGQIRFLIAPVRGSRKGFWCSEWLAAALGSPEPWRYSPNILYDSLVIRIVLGGTYKQVQ